MADYLTVGVDSGMTVVFRDGTKTQIKKMIHIVRHGVELLDVLAVTVAVDFDFRGSRSRDCS